MLVCELVLNAVKHPLRVRYFLAEPFPLRVEIDHPFERDEDFAPVNDRARGVVRFFPILQLLDFRDAGQTLKVAQILFDDLLPPGVAEPDDKLDVLRGWHRELAPDVSDAVDRMLNERHLLLGLLVDPSILLPGERGDHD